MSGVILCGGASRRMGTEKALVTFAGEPLVLRVARLLSAVASPVFLASGRRGRLGDLGYDEVEDAPEGTGPLAGMVAGMAASPHPIMAVAAVDMPFANPSVFELLARAIEDADAAIPVTDEGTQPLHAVYAVRAAPALQEALRSGHLAVRDVVSGVLRVRWVERDGWGSGDPTGRFALNLNRPDERSRFERMAAEP